MQTRRTERDRTGREGMRGIDATGNHNTETTHRFIAKIYLLGAA
jgi:hypothetical protein